MNKLLIAISILLFPITAQANQSVIQTGTVSPGHSVMWTTDGVVQDAGSATAGLLTNLGITATGLPFCINDAAVSSPGGYHQFCLGANVSSKGLLSFNAYGGASPLPFYLNINGTNYPFPGTGSGNVVGPGASTIGDISTFGNTVGSALLDSGVGAANGGLTVNPTPASLAPGFVENQTLAGTSSTNCSSVVATGFEYPCVNLFQVSSDNVNVTATANALDGWQFNYNVGGSSVVGVRQGIDAIMNVTAPSSSSNAGNFYLPLAAQANMLSPDGGTGFSPSLAKGNVAAFNAVARSVPSATYLSAVEAIEIDLNMTGTALQRYGIFTVSGPTNQGHSYDAAYAVAAGAATGAIGWHNALLLTAVGGFQPLDTTGCVICTDGVNYTIGTGVDLSPLTITGAAFKSPGYQVDGSGNLTANNVTPAWTPFTPTLSCGSGTLTTASASGRSRTMGKTTFIEISVVITTNGSCAGSVGVALPNNAQSAAMLAGRATVVSGKMLVGSISASSGAVSILNYDATYPGATGETLVVSGVYENQ